MRSASPAISTEPSFVTSPPGFQDLYERYADAVYPTALRVTGNTADAEAAWRRLSTTSLSIRPISARHVHGADRAISRRPSFGQMTATAGGFHLPDCVLTEMRLMAAVALKRRWNRFRCHKPDLAQQRARPGA
jgi:hypothetical protein